MPNGTRIYFDGNPGHTNEINQDICIAGLAAQGANVACYFTDYSQMGWVDLIHRVLHPDAGDFPVGVNQPTVLTASWLIAQGDDPDGLWLAGIGGISVTTNTLQTMTAAFQDAAILQSGPTICICAGDWGSNNQLGRYANPEYYIQLTTTAAAPVGGNVLTFASTLGVDEIDSTPLYLGAYADPTTGVWYFMKLTAISPTTITVQTLDNVTQTWTDAGFDDIVPAEQRSTSTSRF